MEPQTAGGGHAAAVAGLSPALFFMTAVGVTPWSNFAMYENPDSHTERLGRMTIVRTQEQLRMQSISVARAFFNTLVIKDRDALLSLWHEDGIQEMPFAPEGVPRQINGHAELRTFWSAVFDGVAEIAFSSIELRAMDDPSVVLSQHQGSVKLTNGTRYDNQYVSIFYLRGARIAAYREYFDPLIVLRAWGSAADLGQRFGKQ